MTAIAPIRCLVLLGVLMLGSAGAAEPAAAPARAYAVVSLIGDQFSVISRRLEVGSRLDPNDHTELPVAEPVFDHTAADAVEKAILAAWPGTAVLKVSIRDPRLFALQDKLLEESPESHAMRLALKDLLAKAGATDLVLITKQRGEPSFRLVDGMLARPGWLSGIGFYIDNVTPMHNTERRLTGEGFLAPYAYLNVALLELPSLRVVKTRHALESTMALPQDNHTPAAHAWQALSPDDKVAALDRVIRKAVGNGMASVLAP